MGYQVGVGQKAGNHNFPFLSPNSPPNPQIKNEYCSAGALPSGRPFPVAQVCNALTGRQAPRFIVLAPQPAGSPRPREFAAPSLEEGGWGSPIPYSSPRSNNRPLPILHLLPANLSLKRNQAVSGRRGVGAVQMLGRGRLGRREKQEALAALNLSPPLRHAVTWIPLCHGSSGPTGSSSADSQPWVLAPGSPWPSSSPEAESRGPRAGSRSHHILLTPTIPVLLVLGHGGPGTGGSEALSPRSLFSWAPGCWQWEALCPHWAQYAQTLRMLLWRWWEGEGRRKRMNQAQHHKPEFTQISASHPPTSAHPHSVKTVTDDVL